MSMELKENEEYIIQYYEFIPDSEYLDSRELEKYQDWLNGYRKMNCKLVNIVRHPNMTRNTLIHYFTKNQ